MRSTKKNLLLLVFSTVLAFSSSAQQDTVVYYNFSSACVIPPPGWLILNVDGGDCTWRCDGGMTQNNHSSQGCNSTVDANDWLISPALPLNAFKGEILNFNTNNQYSGPPLVVRYSTTYPGSGNPNPLTWPTLPATFPGFSGNVNLSGITGDSVYIAFHYTSTGNGNGDAQRWTVLDVYMKGTKTVYIRRPVATGISSTSAYLGAEVVDSGKSEVRERGIVWGLSANPAINGPGTTRITRTGSIGIYDTLVNSLPPGTRIHYRGYALNNTDTSYTRNDSFYTLASEPSAHPAAFDANAISSRSIVLNWSAVPSASGYLILHKQAATAFTPPSDARVYSQNEVLGDAVVARVISSSSTITDTIKNLLTGTRYYFMIVPFGITGSIGATANYLTTPVIAVANDSTTGFPFSQSSDITAVTGSESNGISSHQNTATINLATDGERVWKLAFRDGGAASPDPDDMPTVFKSFKIYPGVSNTVNNWQTIIQSAALFDDSTGAKIGTLTVSPQLISITSLNIVAGDNNLRTATLRLSLKKTVPVTDNTIFHFFISDSATQVETNFSSSQLTGFYASTDSTKNKVSVSAVKMRLVQQPASLIEAGTVINPITVELVDSFNNTDRDNQSVVTATAVKNNLMGGTQQVTADSGRAVFSNLSFSFAKDNDTLVFASAGADTIRSSKFKVRNSGTADIIPDPAFVYTSDIPYYQYRDTISLTTATSVPVFGFVVRDGGNNADKDSASTYLSSMKFIVTNPQFIRSLALFSGSSKLGEITVTTSPVQFSGINTVIPDNGFLNLTLRATFRNTVTDRSRIQFKVSEAVSLPDTVSSTFAAADAGGAPSSVFLNENKLDVKASLLKILQQPSSAGKGAAIHPYITLLAVDSNNNTDYEGNIISVAPVKGTLASASVLQAAVNPVNGIITFDKIIFSDTVTAAKLLFTGNSISATSDSFDITESFWYRSVKTGDWDSTTTWEYSKDTGNTWLISPQDIPDSKKHGRILIRPGHTVTMRGSVEASRTLDETVIEENATLVTPVQPNQYLTVNDGPGIDLVIHGKLKHTNNTLTAAGIVFSGQANAEVTGTVELNANDDALNWAGNPAFRFTHGSVYLHNTSFSRSINAGIYFPAVSQHVIPVFRFGADYQYSPLASDLNALLTINGMVEVAPGKTVSFTNPGLKLFRDGLRADGHVALSGKGRLATGSKAGLSGAGELRLSDSAVLEIPVQSTLDVLSDKKIITSNYGKMEILGRLNLGTNKLSGSASFILNDGATLTTANTGGVNTAAAFTGKKSFGAHSVIVLNDQSGAQEVNISNNTTIGKLIIDNPYGVILKDTLTISDTLDLASGGLKTMNGLIVLNPGSAILHADAARFISGRVKAELNAAGSFTIPVGKEERYAPVILSSGESGPASVVVEYLETTPSQTPVTASAGWLKRVQPGDTWFVQEVQGHKQFILTLPYDLALQAGESDEDIRIATWFNNTWVSRGPEARDAAGGFITSSPLEPSGYFALAIDSSCTAPAAPSIPADTICYGASAVFQAGALADVKWFTLSSGGEPVASGNSFTSAALSADTIFYVQAQQRSCVSPRVPVNIMVVQPLAPPVFTNDYVQLCNGSVLQMNASAPAGSVKWYASVTGQQEIASGNSFQSQALSRDTAFYAATGLYGCSSTRSALTVNVKAPVAAPSVKDTAVCKASKAVLLASAAGQVKWYTSAISAAPVFTGNMVSIPSLTEDTTLYVEATEGACVSPRIQIKASSLAVPAVPVLSSLGFACKNEAALLQAQSNTPVRWFNAERDSFPAFTGLAFNTGNLSMTTVYFVDAFNGQCSSGKLAYPVQVIEKPEGIMISRPVSAMRTDSVMIAANGIAADEYVWNFGEGAEPLTAAGKGPHKVKWVIPGNKKITLTASNTYGPFACSVVYTDSVFVTPITALKDDQPVLSGLRVYPNPANELLHISFVLERETDIRVSMMNEVGKLVWEEERKNASGFEQQVAVGTLMPGVYLLRAEAGNTYITKKIIVTR